MKPEAELVVPRLSWADGRELDASAPEVVRALALGVGGFVLEGGTPDAVLAFVRGVRKRSGVPLLFGADGMRGAGQVFRGATGLPPFEAIGRLRDDDAVRRAARLAAREARTAGINWLLAPSADLALRADNAQLGPDTFGADPRAAAEAVGLWVSTCQAEGVLATACHFPGLGRTRDERGAVVLEAPDDRLQAAELVPFRAAVAAGVAAMLVAPVQVPAWDAAGAPADRSSVILDEIVRDGLGFDDLVVARAVPRPEEEAAWAVAAARAGVDLLVGVTQVEAVVAALGAALEAGELPRARVDAARRRRRKWAQWATPPSDFLKPAASDLQWGAQLADRALDVRHDSDTVVRAPIDIVVIPDGEAVAGIGPLLDALRVAGVTAREVPRPVPGMRGTVVAAVVGGAEASTGRFGWTAATVDRVRALIADAEAGGRRTVVAAFGHPRTVPDAIAGAPIVSAWTADPAMQAAVARWLAARRRTA